jgi:hypothetical protein
MVGTRPDGQRPRFGLLDALIVLAAAVILTLLLIWVAGQIRGRELVNDLPDWIVSASQSIWSWVAAAGSSALLVALRRGTSKGAPGPNYLLPILATSAGFLTAVLVVAAMVPASVPVAARADSAGTELGDSVQFDRIVEARFAVTGLVDIIKGYQHVGNGMCFDEGSEEDSVTSYVWTGAQCLTALARAPEFDELLAKRYSAGVHYFASTKQLGGWSRYPGKPPVTEVTAWVGTALAEGLQQGLSIWENTAIRDSALVLLSATDSLIRAHQNRSGAWRSFFDAGETRPAYGEYATYVALHFLLTVRQSRLLTHDRTARDSSIVKGLKALWGLYDREAHGWLDGERMGPQPDLTTLYLLVLAEARRQGIKIRGEEEHYLHAVSNWISELPNTTSRSPTNNLSLRQVQTAQSQKVDLVESSFPVAIVWHPWTLLLVDYLLNDSSIEVDRRALGAAAARLWHKLRTFLEAEQKSAPFVFAEMLYGIKLMNGI